MDFETFSTNYEDRYKFTTVVVPTTAYNLY